MFAMRPTMKQASIALVSLIVLLATATPVSARDLPPLAKWPVSLDSGPIDLRANDGRGWQEPGRWSARRIHRGPDGHLRFTLRVTPAPVHLPVRSGPAVLFVGIGYYGGGSVGYEEVVRVTRQTAPACRRDPCTYRFDVDADLSGLPAAAAASRRVGREVQAKIGVTLVRTFGDGSWMQVLNTFHGRSTLVPGRTGQGRVASMGLVPVRAAEAWSQQQDDATLDLVRRVARATQGMPDPSEPLPTVRVRLAIDAAGCWPFLRLAIHDDQGARPLDARLLDMAPTGTIVDVPDGLPWTVSLWETGIFDANETGGISSQAGSFTTAGEDLDVLARYSCQEPGVYPGSLTVAPASGELASPTALHRVVSTPVLEGPQQGRKRPPFTVTGTSRGYLALGWTPDGGWIEWSSRDGVRWHSRPVASIDGLPSPPDLLDVRLWSADGSPRLTTITAMPDGSRQVRIWRRSGPIRWSSMSILEAGAGTGALRDPGEAGSVTAFAGHGDDALLLVSPDGKASAGPARLLHVDASGRWGAVGPADGEVASIAATADGFVLAARTTGADDTPDSLLTSTDGATWESAGTLPTATLGRPQLAVAEGTLLAFASDATGMTRGWRRDADGSWSPTLDAIGSVFPGSVGAHDRMVTVLTRIDLNEETLTAAAISRDGGHTWVRGDGIDESPRTCRISLAIMPGSAVVGAGGCRAWSAATRLAFGGG